MARDNNGVKSKVTNDVGRGSIERGGGMAGKERGMGGREGLYENQNVMPRTEDQSQQRGLTSYPKISPTEKNMGGVGDNKGTNGPANDFRQPHGR